MNRLGCIKRSACGRRHFVRSWPPCRAELQRIPTIARLCGIADNKTLSKGAIALPIGAGRNDRRKRSKYFDATVDFFLDYASVWNVAIAVRIPSMGRQRRFGIAAVFVRFARAGPSFDLCREFQSSRSSNKTIGCGKTRGLYGQGRRQKSRKFLYFFRKIWEIFAFGGLYTIPKQKIFGIFEKICIGDPSIMAHLALKRMTKEICFQNSDDSGLWAHPERNSGTSLEGKNFFLRFRSFESLSKF